MISIVIPNLHSPRIGETVAALQRQTAAARIREIIVVGQDRYGLTPPGARFIETGRPVPAAAARNRGAAAAGGEYLLFVDADCIAAPDLVARMLERLEHGSAVVSGGVAIDSDDYWVVCDNLLSFGPWLAAAPAGERPYLPSLCLGIRRDLFEQAGGFDERFPGAAGEDMDLCLRLRAAGHRLEFEPAALVTHRPPRTTARATWQHLRGYGRAHLRARRRNERLHPSPLDRVPSRWAFLLLAGAPLLATADLLRSFLRRPELRAHPSALPGMIWGKIGWYFGVAESLAARPSA